MFKKSKITTLNDIKILEKSTFSGIIFVFLFVAPHTILSAAPSGYQKPILYSLFICHGILFISMANLFFNKNYFKLSVLTIIFISIGLINLAVHKSTSLFNLVGPVVGLIGYCYYSKNEINTTIFNFYLISLYVFFYFEYYSIIPDLFYRPDFDEDAAVFDISSSNAIPVSLNITLYAYIICDKNFDNNSKGKIVIFAAINFALIVIQQSRAGLMVSLTILGIALYHYSKRILFFFATSLTIIVAYIVPIYWELIETYIEIIGKIDENSLNEDIRGEAQTEFFKNMNISEFIFGHDKKIYASAGNTELAYTYNVFLDMWDKYGFIIIVIFGLLFLNRTVRRNEFEFPLYYFIPFFMYSMVESFFFPDYWDCIIYILIFQSKNHKIYSRLNINVKS